MVKDRKKILKMFKWSCVKTDMDNLRASKTHLQKMIFKTKNLIILKKNLGIKANVKELSITLIFTVRTKFERSKFEILENANILRKIFYSELDGDRQEIHGTQ